jgi:hypothetical protein
MTPAQLTLLLMPCSASKLPHAEQPRQLYTGPMWQTLRQHRGALPWENVMVLSGKFGFISAQTFIQTYEARLTPAKADRMIARGIHAPNDHHGELPALGGHGSGCCALDTVVLPGRRGRRPFETVINAGGADYRRVFDSFIPELIAAGAIAPDAQIRRVAGGIGEQRQQLGQWLRGLNAPPISAAA